jgi:predicted PurR-regulated permease PerM
VHSRPPAWRDSADAWFKLLGAIVFGYLILAGVAAQLRQCGGVAIILVGGILLAYLVLPAVTWLRSRLPLWAALTIVYATRLLAIAAIAYVLLPTASAQFTSLVHNIPAMARAIEAFISDPNNVLVRHLPTFMQSWIQTLPAKLVVQLQTNAIAYSSSVVTAIGTLTFLRALAVAIPVVSIYNIHVSPLAVIFALLIGAQLFGFAGLIVAVPLAGLARIALIWIFP